MNKENEETINEETIKKEEPAADKKAEAVSELKDDALDMHYMSKKERRQYKKERYRRYTEEMSKPERISFFFTYYGWAIALTVCALVFGVMLARTLYLNSRPIALGALILNTGLTDEEATTATDYTVKDYAEALKADYSQYYHIEKGRFTIIDKLRVNLDTYQSEIMSNSTNNLTSYETIFYQVQADNIDVILADRSGVDYATKMDLVYPLFKVLNDADTALVGDHLAVFTSSAGDHLEYAVDITDTAFAKRMDFGYAPVYVIFPSISEKNLARARQFLRYVYESE